MTLTVENGTGLSTADSYVSLVDAAAYHTKFGNTAWAAVVGGDPGREILLLKATRYIDAVYGPRFVGSRILSTQALAMPRYPVYATDDFLIDYAGQLVILARATSEMALRAISEDIYPDLANSGIVSSEAKAIGPISKATTYLGGKSPLKQYRLVEDILYPLIGGGLLCGEVVRS